MFRPPELPHVLVYFDKTSEVTKLHEGEDFGHRLETEIAIHQGQIEAENFLLNSIARLQSVATKHNIESDVLAELLRSNKYSLEKTTQALREDYNIPEEAFSESIDFEPIDTADYMRQRASMIGAVLSSTPVLLRDPWQGKPVTAKYGFSDFKADVDGVGFSAIATPRHKGIPFRFAVMKHEHDGFADNNPAMIMSDEFCDAFAEYNKAKYEDIPAQQHPLILALATNLKPNIHDRFHNWFLYDINAASETFKQWGNDIYFVDHNDSNPLLINYEQIALCFHLYSWQTLFDKNPELKDNMYLSLENCIEEIESLGEFLKASDHPKAQEILESTVYAVASNICFVLNPYEDRFQNILNKYPDVAEKLLAIREDGKGLGRTLERLHAYEDGVPSQKFGGAKEAVFEYMLRYPLVDEIRSQLRQERSGGKPDDWQIVDGKKIYTTNLKEYEALPPELKNQMKFVRDSGTFAKINKALAGLPEGLRQDATNRIEVSEEGYLFFRIDRKEIDYTELETRNQKKQVILIDVPEGEEIRFDNIKRLSVKDKVRKQSFTVVGGEDVVAINAKDDQAANAILDAARNEDGTYDAQKAIDKAKDLAEIAGVKTAADMYKIKKSVAASEELYGFTESGLYRAELEKNLAKMPGPAIMELNSGGDQRLVKGALIYLSLGKDSQQDQDPDSHFIENTDFKLDYGDLEGTDKLKPFSLNESSSLMQHEDSRENAAELIAELMQTLHQVNFQITHGASKTESIARGGGGLFS